MASIVFLSLFLLLVSQSSALCTLKHNGTLAQCRYLEDVKDMPGNLRSLKITAVARHLASGSFENLTNLQHLDLSHGKLRRIEPGTFGNLKNLLSLDLSHNHLTHLGKGTFEGPENLRVLNLRKNALTRVPSDAIELKNLKFLELSSNKLHCDCKTLRTRDELLKRGVITSKKAVCAGPGTLKGTIFTEPEADVICMFEEQDKEMQRDQPIAGSGEIPAEVPAEVSPEKITPDVLSEDSSSVTPELTATEAPSVTTGSAADDVFFNEEEKLTSASVPTSSEAAPTKSRIDELFEGSGDEVEGSGIEASGHPFIPPISWDNVVEDDDSSTLETVTQDPTTTTTSTSFLGFLTGWFTSGNEATSTTEEPSTTTSQELRPEDEGFLPTQEPKEPVEEIIVPASVSPVEGEKKPDEASIARVIQEPAVGSSATPAPVHRTEATNAASTTETKKGIGSYVVLGVLIGVLVALVGVATYKGDFCRKMRKRNSREADGRDPETGTELKDLRKSLLEQKTASPKIASNGGKPESVPLVNSAIPEESKIEEEPTAKFAGSVPESSADPVKPPRRSFSPNEIERNGTNGKVPSSEIASEPIPIPRTSTLVNGNNRDSMGSVDSYGNQRNSNPISDSPGTHRVKITMQENPDSVPKTPLLITRTKAGENLVKTP
uniref:LRRCT domain-containing protein n=1 Tax=Bracon brevicornis TaxID=1563983 RepID=A0A6V7JH83_9HYME